MSSNPDGARGAKLQNNPSLPFLLGCCCIGLIMLAAALTIVMALIPTYLPDAGDGMSRVNATSMEAYLAAQATASGAKRATGGPSDYVGCTFDGTSLDIIADKIGQHVKNRRVTGVSIAEIIIGRLVSGKRKRSLLSRNARATSTLIYMIQAYFEVADDCLYSCQLDVADELQTKLTNIPSGVFTLGNVVLYKDGGLCGTLDSVSFFSFYPLTKLTPGKTKRRRGSRPGLQYNTDSATSSMTTAMSG